MDKVSTQINESTQPNSGSSSESSVPVTASNVLPGPTPLIAPTSQIPLPKGQNSHRSWVLGLVILLFIISLAAMGWYFKDKLLPSASTTPPKQSSSTTIPTASPSVTTPAELDSFSGYTRLVKDQPIHLNSSVTLSFTKTGVQSRDDFNKQQNPNVTGATIGPGHKALFVLYQSQNSSSTKQSPINASDSKIPQLHIVDQHNRQVDIFNNLENAIQSLAWSSFTNLAPGSASNGFIWEVPESADPTQLYLTIVDDRFSPAKSYLPLNSIL